MPVSRRRRSELAALEIITEARDGTTTSGKMPMPGDVASSPLRIWLENRCPGNAPLIEAVLVVVETSEMVDDDAPGQAAFKLMRGLTRTRRRVTERFPIVACAPLAEGQGDDVMAFQIVTRGESDVLCIPIATLKQHRSGL
jgi:hypothetical protein